MNLRRSIFACLGSIGLVFAASIVCEGVRSFLAPTNMVMAYLLAVVIAAAWLGLWPAILTAFLSVVAFDVLFVPPRFSFRVSDSQYMVTFFALFVVGVVISSLVSKIQEKVEQVQTQESRTSSLYYLTRDLSAAVDVPTVVDALSRAVGQNPGARVAIAFDRGTTIHVMPMDSGILAALRDEIIRWVMTSGRRAGNGAAAFPEVSSGYFPMKSGGAVIGVMVVDGDGIGLTENVQILEAFAAQVAMALERIELSRQAEEARVLVQKTHLEQALLNSISHDLRTPLVIITGALDALLHNGETISAGKRRELVATAGDEAVRLNRFVGSLLDMTRIEAGALSLHVEESDVDEIIGCALAAVEQRRESRNIVTSVEPGVPPVPVDLALITQALMNLLDNALKYSPPAEAVTFSARAEGNNVVFGVADNGPGVPIGEEQRIFEKFYRLDVPEKGGGTGLGLSIAKGIIEAHNGTIKAINRREGGLLVEVALPVPLAGQEGTADEE